MHRRRLGLSFALLGFMVLVAIKPPMGQLRLSLDAPTDGSPLKVEAGLDLGAFALSVLVHEAARRAR